MTMPPEFSGATWAEAPLQKNRGVWLRNNSAGAPSDNAPPAVSTSTSLLMMMIYLQLLHTFLAPLIQQNALFRKVLPTFLAKSTDRKFRCSKIDRSSKRKKNKKKATAQAKGCCISAKINKNRDFLVLMKMMMILTIHGTRIVKAQRTYCYLEKRIALTKRCQLDLR